MNPKDGRITVTVEGKTVGHDGEEFHKEFEIEQITSAKGRFVLIDDDGEGRLILTAEELGEIVYGERGDA